MADEDITLDGKPLHSLRVADLKAALEKRNLPKSGQKNTLIKRLKGALMLENLQKSSSSHSGLQPNSQIGEEMCQNSFIKQYLAKQQELLRQRLEREAQRVEGADESPAVPEEDEEHSEDNESSSYMSDKQRCPRPSQSTLSRAEERGGGALVGHGMISYSSDTGPSPALHCQESPEAPGARMQRAMGHKDPPVPSPPRAVASLSVRVLGKPDHQGLPPAVPRVQEKEGTAPSEPGSAHPVLHLSRSAGVSTGSNVYKDSDDDDGDDECDDDEDWGPGPGKARKGNRVPPQPQQMPPNVPSASARSKRKLQPPQHIPPPQVHHTPMQLRHPTPPPSPPPDLFPLPDTPKQSPPDPEHQEGEVPVPGPRMPSFPPPSMQRQDSDSSSRSSSPEPSVKCWSGPLSLLVHKMESEGAFHESAKISEDTAPSAAGSSSKSPLKKMDRKTQENREESEKEREQQYEQERERRKAEEQEREKKSMEEEKEERKRLEEEEREQEGKHQDDKERREEKQQKEDQDKKQLAAQDRKVVTKSQDSGSSSDSDSGSDSSSQSSQSSSSSRDKPLPSRPPKKVGQKDEEKKKTNLSEVSEQQQLSKREVSEPSAASVTEVEPDTESSVAEQPVSGAQPENSENRMEESTTPKAFAARKISLTSSKTSPATTDGGGEAETGTGAGRKRRWGSSTAVTAKKPSISITTDSLKSLIPDIKINQDPVVDLHAEELQLSGDEENMAKNCSDQDTGLKIRRTVTQVVPGDSQENGQADQKEEGEKTEREKQRRTSRDKRKSSLSEEASETQMHVKLEEEVKKVTPSDTLVRRSISQQKSGVSITIDDPVRTAKQPSPPCGKISNIIHVTNLVRPFTLGQLKELLSRTGTMVEEGFWIDKIKSHCFVTYATTEEAVATRAAINGANWPSSNPKVLSVNFCEQDELDFHKGILKPERVEDHCVQPVPPQNRPPPLMPERDRDRDRERERDKEHERDRERGVAGVRDLWAEREREMERRERARGEREWDRDKVREFARPGEDGRRSRSRDKERRKRDRAKSKERRTDKKEKADEPPAKLLDDLFLKTKAAPCIYWLPLTEEQAAQRLLERTERQKERERRRKEQQEEEEKKREEEKKERLKVREKESDVVVSSGAAARGPNGDRERDRGRDREGDKRRDGGHRPGRLSAGAGSGRRSRSRSNPRDRRR